MADQFACPNPNCGYAIAADTLNRVQLKALERWGKTCPNCKQFGSFTKQQTLFDTQTNETLNGGAQNANNQITRQDYRNENRRQKRRGNWGH